MQEIKYFSDWRFAAEGQSRVRSTNSLKVCRRSASPRETAGSCGC
jgi:hypothetical protein